MSLVGSTSECLGCKGSYKGTLDHTHKVNTTPALGAQFTEMYVVTKCSLQPCFEQVTFCILQLSKHVSSYSYWEGDWHHQTERDYSGVCSQSSGYVPKGVKTPPMTGIAP